MLLAACGNADNKENTNGTNNAIPTMVEVEIKLPENVELNKEVKIEALVTQGDDNVDDANEVLFEIWRQGHEEDHEKIEATNDGEGVYSISKTFEEDGFYYVVAHTTARDMHVMPRVELTVGNPEPTEHDHDDHEETEHHDHHSHGSEHDNSLSLTFLPETSVVVNKETTLQTELSLEDVAFTGADVRFEIWHKDSENHTFIDAEEVNDGIYEAKTTFDQNGLHYVQIHVEKDDLHEHQIEELEVQ